MLEVDAVCEGHWLNSAAMLKVEAWVLDNYFFSVVFSFCIVCIFNLSSVLYFPA